MRHLFQLALVLLVMYTLYITNCLAGLHELGPLLPGPFNSGLVMQPIIKFLFAFFFVTFDYALAHLVVALAHVFVFLEFLGHRGNLLSET